MARSRHATTSLGFGLMLGWLCLLVETGARAESSAFVLGSAAVSNDGVRWIRAPWKVHVGDDPSWAAPDFDDSAWPSARSTMAPGAPITDWSGIAWFRLQIEVPREMVGKLLPVYGRYVGAAEVFVDGQRLFAVADPGAVVASGSTPVRFAAIPEWVTFQRPGRHLIAVRFASVHVANMNRIGFPAGFDLSIGHPPTDVRWTRLFSRMLHAAFVGATLVLSLLHLLLFAFYRDKRENLYYALTAVGVAGITYCQQAILWAETATEVIVMLGGFGASVTLSTVLMLRFYYAVFSPQLPRRYWLILVVGCGLAIFAWTTPRTIYYGFVLLVSIEQFRVLITAVVKRVNGAWIIGIGGGLWLTGAVLQMLGDTGVITLMRYSYLVGFLGLLVSISVYLARDIARDKADLARRLLEIGELSTKEREAKERYRTIFETTGTATIIFDDDAVIALANDEWAQLTGYARCEIEGKLPWMEFFSEESLKKMKRYHELRSKDPASAPRTYEAQLVERRGKLHEGVVTISMVPGTTQRVGSFLDLTDLKRAQREMVRADKMAALGQIIAGVAHEINNPNNFIHFNLPILRKYVEAMRPLLEVHLEQDPELELLNMRYEVFLEDLFKLLENMEHGSQRITSIVADLKTYIRSGEDTVMKTGSIDKVIDQVMTLVGKQVRKMVKRLDVTVAEGLPTVKMNAGKIEQVLINLVINAGQAADKDASWIKLAAQPADDGIEVLIEDNGGGIPKESLELIFEPFYTSKGRDAGTGLGLSISHQIIEEHGGRIDVSSELGQGTRFAVWLPAA